MLPLGVTAAAPLPRPQDGSLDAAAPLRGRAPQQPPPTTSGEQSSQGLPTCTQISPRSPRAAEREPGAPGRDSLYQAVLGVHVGVEGLVIVHDPAASDQQAVSLAEAKRRPCSKPSVSTTPPAPPASGRCPGPRPSTGDHSSHYSPRGQTSARGDPSGPQARQPGLRDDRVVPAVVEVQPHGGPQPHLQTDRPSGPFHLSPVGLWRCQRLGDRAAPSRHGPHSRRQIRL